MEMLIMILGFALAAYSVVGNDVIQTLGTFLTSNERRPWWVLWLYAGGILSVVLVLGFTGYGGFLGGDDVCFDRLDKINIPDTLSWWYILPPLILLFITRWGIPVSTTFLILSFFSTKSLPGMLFKSLLGYALAFAFAIVIYLLISKALEKKFQEKPLLSGAAPFWQSRRFWTGAQWLSTGFLWTQWL